MSCATINPWTLQNTMLWLNFSIKILNHPQTWVYYAPSQYLSQSVLPLEVHHNFWSTKADEQLCAIYLVDFPLNITSISMRRLLLLLGFYFKTVIRTSFVKAVLLPDVSNLSNPLQSYTQFYKYDCNRFHRPDKIYKIEISFGNFSYKEKI